jgi:hypothetical protein
MKNPRTSAEWQEAVDMAHACLALDSARQYGLVTGGPGVNVARCIDILDEGKRRGVAPSPDAIENFVKAFAA